MTRAAKISFGSTADSFDGTKTDPTTLQTDEFHKLHIQPKLEKAALLFDQSIDKLKSKFSGSNQSYAPDVETDTFSNSNIVQKI